MAKKKKAAAKGTTTWKKARVKKATGRAEVHPDQNQLNGFEDDRLPTVEQLIKQIVRKNESASALKAEVAELSSELLAEMKSLRINSYQALGKQVVIEPGDDSLKFLKAKKRD